MAKISYNNKKKVKGGIYNMKEATGELNMTVITVVAIAAVAAFFYAFVWPNIKTSINRNTICASAWGCTDCDGKNCTCSYCEEGDAECNNPKTIKCPDQSSSGSETKN